MTADAQRLQARGIEQQRAVAVVRFDVVDMARLDLLGACLREVLGQLLEYAYWPGMREASRLIVCGESPLDDDGQKYVDELRHRFQLPFSYQQIAL